MYECYLDLGDKIAEILLVEFQGETKVMSVY